MINTKIADLYKLTPLEFEQLVTTLLSETGFSDLKIVDGPGDRGVDIIGTENHKKVAIQVKHKKNLTLSELRRFTDKYFSDPLAPTKTLIYVTSAKSPQGVETIINELPQDCSLRIIDQDEINKILTHRYAASSKFFDQAVLRLKNQRNNLILGVTLACISTLVALWSDHNLMEARKTPLNNRITNVEKAINNIKDLEIYLTSFKNDLVETEKATQIINQKYSKAKELEKLSEVQIEALKSTLQTESWRRTLFNYLLGFVLGIASSFVASVMYAKWQQHRALE